MQKSATGDSAQSELRQILPCNSSPSLRRQLIRSFKIEAYLVGRRRSRIWVSSPSQFALRTSPDVLLRSSVRVPLVSLISLLASSI
ncbi:unnamed protein product [Linum trigynum]|uniref:Uncharacterized protein n=1 Tax=Linum trigynum TaxID=586398 RepID=A0AAV2GAS9_9ROSI